MGHAKGATLKQEQRTRLYKAIASVHKEMNICLQLLCEITGIPRSSYYKWTRRIPSLREQQNESLIQMLQTMHKDVNGIFGYRRLTSHLRRKTGRVLNHKRVRRLMKLANIECVIRRKRKRYPRSTPQHVTENLLNRQFRADEPNEKWLTDVTELKYASSQKAYLSAVLDLYSNTIVSYVISHSNNNRLVMETLDRALESAPGSHPMIHSDRGFQYTSLEFKRRIDAAQMTHSMSRVGRCIDNGPMESFFGTLKCERYYLRKYDSFEELEEDMNNYIHFYNHERLQAKLNDLSPIEYRTKAA
jgi:transposase InsO family protein